MFMRIIVQFLFIFLSSVLYTRAMPVLQNDDELRQMLWKAKTLIYTKPDEAIRLIEKILVKADKDSSLRVSSLIIAASAYTEKSYNDKAIKCLVQAQEIVERKKDFVNQIRILGLLGYQYQNLQMNEKARFYLDAAEQVDKSHPLPDSLQYLKGNIFSIKGLSYRDDLDCDFANKYFNKAIATYKAAKNDSLSNTNLSVIYIHKGYCFIDKGVLDSATYVFQQAEDLIRKNKLQPDILIMQKTGMAKIYSLKKEYLASIQLLNDALKISKNIPQLDSHTQIYQLLSENYLQINDLEHYKYFNKLYSDNMERLSESEKRMFARTISFEYNENEKQLHKS